MDERRFVHRFIRQTARILFTARPNRLLAGMGTKNGVQAEPFGRLAFQLALGFALALSGGTPTATECPLVVTQCPVPAQTDSVPRDVLDLRYPTGSRLVLMRAPFEPQQSECLSTGLSAAGDPVISPDGRRVLFPGKAQVDRAWQIYEAALPGGHPRALTSMPGGAMDPALLPDGRLIFASPVPAAVPGDSNHSLPALYWATAGAEPVQLSFSSVAITEPVVLSDGRILFHLAATRNLAVRGPRVGAVHHQQRWHGDYRFFGPARCPQAARPAQATG